MNTIAITKAGQGEHYLFGADVTTVRASSAVTSGRLLMLEVVVPPGGGPPTLHRHKYVEIFQFLEGTFAISTTDERRKVQSYTVGAGDIVAIPSLVWHNFKNVGSTPGRFTVVHTPPVMEELLHKVGQPISDPHNPPHPAGPPAPAQMQQLLAEIGKYMEMLPPDAIVQ